MKQSTMNTLGWQAEIAARDTFITDLRARIAELEAELNQEVSIDLVSGEVSHRPAAAPEVAAEQPAAESMGSVGNTMNFKQLMMHRPSDTADEFFWRVAKFIDARAHLSAAGQEPLVWEATTPVYIPFVTEARYQKFSAAAKKWYRPVCQKCAAGQGKDSDASQ